MKTKTKKIIINQTKKLTYSAVLIALIIVWQLSTKAFTPIVTGPVVNLILLVAVDIAGLTVGIIAASMSPIFATILGVNALWVIVPFIMIGNIIYVIVWHFINKITYKSNSSNLRYTIIYTTVRNIIAAIIASVAKFTFFYFILIKLAIPYMLSLPAPQAAKIADTFFTLQLITALIGGAIAIIILPALKKALKLFPFNNSTDIDKPNLNYDTNIGNPVDDTITNPTAHTTMDNEINNNLDA